MLDISGGKEDFRVGNYETFAKWRSWILYEMGYNNVEEYMKKHNHEGHTFDTQKGYFVNADMIPLGLILLHSDCDGIIPNDLVLTLKVQLQTFKQKLALENKWLSTQARVDARNELENIAYYQEMVDLWIECCKSAIELKTPIRFNEHG